MVRDGADDVYDLCVGDSVIVRAVTGNRIGEKLPTPLGDVKAAVWAEHQRCWEDKFGPIQIAMDKVGRFWRGRRGYWS